MITVIGSSNTNLVVKADRLPSEGETVFGERFIMACGGKGANQAIAIARLGRPVRFIGKIGKDLFGEKQLAQLERNNVEIRFVLRDEEHPSGVALIMVDKDGKNKITVFPGSNAHLGITDLEKLADFIKFSEVLLLQLEVPLETVRRAVEIASANKIRAILNPAPAKELDREILSKAYLLTPNDIEAGKLTGVDVVDEASARKAASMLLNKGANAVVITLGAAGALFMDKIRAGLIPTPQVNAVDTNACGDAFNGALTVAICEGKDLPEAINFANNVAALTATKAGAQESLPERQEVEEFIKSIK